MSFSVSGPAVRYLVSPCSSSSPSSSPSSCPSPSPRPSPRPRPCRGEGGSVVASRLAVVALLTASSFALGGCGSINEDEAGPQFPHGQAEPIGVAGTGENERLAAADVTGVPYAQSSAGAEGADGGDVYPDTDPSALTDFHSALDPYGAWAEDPNYGTIWQPAPEVVGSEFAPYETAGHWSYGDDYTWVSDYSWGWAPFHYGRWVYATNGWGWIPGRQYAGAWTTWRTGYGGAAGYVGWAPLPPTYYWRNGIALGIGVVPPAAYGFCQTGNLFAPSLGGRMVVGAQVGAIGQSTRPVQGASTAGGRGGAYGGAGTASNGAFAGRTVAHPETSGPSPRSMGISSNAVTRTPTNNAGLAHARQFSHPSTATALGAHSPAARSGVAGSAVASSAHGIGGAVSGSYGGGARAPTRSLGTNTTNYRGAFHETRTLGQGGSYHGSSSGFHGGGAPSYGGHSFAHGGASAPAPQYHPPSYGGGYHAPSGGGGGGHFGGHSGGGGGGGHGGGHR